MGSHPHTVVVGAGIIGAAIAYAVAKRGASVTVVDAGGAAGRATHGSFGWINAHGPEDGAYFALRLESMRTWRGLADEIDGLPVRFGGALNWEGPPDALEETARALDAAGNTARLVRAARIREMEPALADPPALAIDMPLEGAAEPDRIAEALLDAATACGAVVRAPVRVTGIAMAGGRVTGAETTEGRVEARRVVVAAGGATPGLLASAGAVLPMRAPEGLLVRTAPVARLSRRVLAGEDLHVWQLKDGSLILGDDKGGSEVGPSRAATEARVLARAQRMFPGVSLVRDRSTLTARPVPDDGHPAVGRVPGTDGLFVAAMHSGVTLAPAIAERLARMVLDDAEAGDLARYGPERFGI